jgi:NADP-dependent aldehyde dehydrogenase
MSSINPVILLPGALESRAKGIADGFVASLTAGVGQFCTNPGIVLAIEGAHLDRFLAAAAASLAKATPGVMLSPAIHTAYRAGVETLKSRAGISTVALADDIPSVNCGAAALFDVAARDFLADDVLSKEMFGPSSIVVRCRDAAELADILERLEGQLTATLHLENADLPIAAHLLPILERKAGRILANGWPTGVEVSDAMVHGGPFPATSDSRTTSVGTLAIERFLRPVCYQDLPQALLAPELQDGNPLKLQRLMNGVNIAA